AMAQGIAHAFTDNLQGVHFLLRSETCRRHRIEIEVDPDRVECLQGAGEGLEDLDKLGRGIGVFRLESADKTANFPDELIERVADRLKMLFGGGGIFAQTPPNAFKAEAGG